MLGHLKIMLHQSVLLCSSLGFFVVVVVVVAISWAAPETYGGSQARG